MIQAVLKKRIYDISECIYEEVSMMGVSGREGVVYPRPCWGQRPNCASWRADSEESSRGQG